MEKCEKLISIIVPVYNVEKYIGECIDSIINQTYKKIEIILVDDGTPDNSGKICDEYAKKDKRIKVIHKENGGLSSARNAGLEIASGDYVTFVDSDDTITVDYTEYLYNLIVKYNTQISVCAYQLVNDSGKIVKTQENGFENKLSSEEYLEKLLYQDHTDSSACAKLFERQLFDNIKFPVGKIFEDTFTTHRLMLKVPYVALGLNAKYNYMMRNDSIMTSSFSEKKLLLIDATNYMNSNILEKFPNLESATIRSSVYARLSIMRQLVFSNPRRKKIEKDLRDYVLKHKKEILSNKKVPSRDKIAIITLIFGCWCFRFFWKLYSKITGRS